MHDKLSKILGKKRDLSDNERNAKMDVVKHLRDMAAEEMGGKLDGLKKVSVMSDSKEGLAKGLDKAKNVLSQSEEDSDRKHAENPYGDYKSALEEHSRDENNQEPGFEDHPNQYADGGQVADQSKLQSAQDSMRRAFGYDEGGEVEEGEESPEEESAESEDGEDHELSEDEIDQQLQHLMALKKKLEAKKS